MKNPGKYFGLFSDGVNSYMLPEQIGERQVAWAENCIARGAFFQTRPGFDWVASFAGSNLQGFTMFKPRGQQWFAVVAVDGKIWVANPPFTDFTQLTALTFDTTAPQIIFCVTVKSTKLNPDGTLEAITPKRVLMMQDDSSPAASWDGVTAQHLDNSPPYRGTPSGKWMAWIGSRLWLAKDNKVYASDLTNPENFTEDTYLAEQSGFSLPDLCTGLVKTADEKMLLAFTETTTTSLQAGIIDRVQWQQTPQFTNLILPEIGCVAGKTPINEYNMTHWLSQAGWLDLNTALFTKLNSRIATIDEPMMRSKRTLAHDLSLSCSGAIENLTLVSVPSGSGRNAHTWVMDQVPLGSDQQAKRAWAGIWTGVNPVEWSTARINGRDRIFFVSHDETVKDGTHLHLWEALNPTRLDNSHAISCQMETGAVWSPINNEFAYAEVDIVEIRGDVHLEGYVGGTMGEWHKILDATLQAEIGCLGSPPYEILTKASTILKSYRPQRRSILTETFNPQGKMCSPETKEPAGTDKGFQFLFQWSGRMGIKGVRIVAAEDPDTPDNGANSVQEFGAHNMVSERGEHIEA